jgi:hypothetical protein
MSFVVGIGSNFFLEPRIWAEPGFLTNAAALGNVIAGIVLIGLVDALLGLLLAGMLLRVYGAQQPLLSRLYFALAVVSFATGMVETCTLQAMSSLSSKWLTTLPDARAGYDAASALLSGLRNGIHFSTKLVEGFDLALFFILLGRAGAISRWIVVLALPAWLAQLIGVSYGIFGLPVPVLCLAPLGLLYPLCALWLLWRGFAR